MLLPFALLASFALSNFLLRKGGFRLFEVPSSGMEQTVFKGEEVIADLQAYRDSHPRERDVVILRKNNDFFMKRVTAVGGETVEGKDGTVFVNHQRQEEPYVQHIGGAPPELKDFGPVEVPRGELFVLGDNRDVSIDSRLQYFGLVAEGDVLGKPLYIIRSQRARIGKKIR